MPVSCRFTPFRSRTHCEPPPARVALCQLNRSDRRNKAESGLSGDNGTSNTDPFATEETPNNNWIKTGSHVMIVGAEATSMMQGYPRAAMPDPTKPYVMWPGTPYEHLMLPVK